MQYSLAKSKKNPQTLNNENLYQNVGMKTYFY